MADDRDWTGFAVIGAQWEWSDAAATKPSAWKVIDPGMVGTQAERDLRYNAWLAERDSPGYTNARAIAQGWPLRDPATASRIQRRRYDRSVYWIGRVIRDRLLAAPLAPGEFSDVDTSVDPPQYYMGSVQAPTIPATAPIPAPILAEDSAASEPTGAVVDVETPADSGPRVGWRTPRVGERVIVRDNIDELVETTVGAISWTAHGSVADVVRVREANADAWRRIVAWPDPEPASAEA